MLFLAWLLLQNFNLIHTVAGAAGTASMCGIGGKSMESLIAKTDAFASYSSIAAQPHCSMAPPPYRMKTIVLDAGHGGKDPGCIGANAKEKDNTLAIVLKVGALLENHFPDLKVVYTRDSDVFVELNERAAIANRAKADLFVSVHCNAMPASSAAHGTETYVLGLHRMDDNLEVAKRENASIYYEDNYQQKYDGYDPNSAEAHIMSSSWQSSYLEQSILFAQYVQQFAETEAEREDRGVKQAGFLVLRETAMPSVLIETGYLTNSNEEEYLASEDGQNQMALSIFEAICAYKDHMESGVRSMVAKTNAKAKTVSKTSSLTASTTLPARETVTKQPVSTPKKPVNTPAAPRAFRIYLLSWPNRLDPNAGQLGLLSNVKEEFKDGKYHYYIGDYTKKEDAEKVLPEIRNLGFSTASIVQ